MARGVVSPSHSGRFENSFPADKQEMLAWRALHVEVRFNKLEGFR
jgi:hypothetical protein